MASFAAPSGAHSGPPHDSGRGVATTLLPLLRRGSHITEEDNQGTSPTTPALGGADLGYKVRRDLALLARRQEPPCLYDLCDIPHPSTCAKLLQTVCCVATARPVAQWSCVATTAWRRQAPEFGKAQPSPGAMWPGSAQSRCAVLMWPGWAQSRCRCGRDGTHRCSRRCVLVPRRPPHVGTICIPNQPSPTYAHAHVRPFPLRCAPRPPSSRGDHR